MSVELDMLRAIAASPDDDAQRMVYADWLVEQGNPRGEVIQLELAFAQMDDFDERKKATKARIAELYEQHGEAWMAPFARLKLPLLFRFDRGIVAGVAGNASALAVSAARLAAGAPLVSRVEIDVGGERDLAPLAGSPLLPRIYALTLGHYTPVRPTSWQVLDVPNARSLTLSSIAAGPDDLAAVLARAPRLTSLAISNCRLNKGAVEAFAHAPPLEVFDAPAHDLGPRLGELAAGWRLRTARLAGNPIGDAGFTALLPALRGVHVLDLRGCEITGPTLGRVCELAHVRELYLGGQRLPETLIARLAEWPAAANLRRLNLGNAALTDRAAQILASTPHLANLRSLVMSGSTFSAATKALLLASPYLANARIFAGSHALGRKVKPVPKRPARKPPPR